MMTTDFTNSKYVCYNDYRLYKFQMCAITENDLMKYIDGFNFFLNESDFTE